jgi:hypothetical protein
VSQTALTFSALTPKVIAAVALVAMMAQLGLALEPIVDRATKRHERWFVLRALAFNFTVVPLLALLAAGASGETSGMPGAPSLAGRSGETRAGWRSDGDQNGEGDDEPEAAVGRGEGASKWLRRRGAAPGCRRSRSRTRPRG